MNLVIKCLQVCFHSCSSPLHATPSLSSHYSFQYEIVQYHPLTLDLILAFTLQDSVPYSFRCFLYTISRLEEACFSVYVTLLLQGISTLKSGGPHAIQGKRGKVKTPLTNQAINHLAVSASLTHSGQKRAEFTLLCKLLCCYKITLPPSQHRRTYSNIATLWETVCLFLALAILDWLLPRTPLHLRACRLPAVRMEIHYSTLLTCCSTANYMKRNFDETR